MRQEVPWKIVGPVLALALVALIMVFARSVITPTVSEKDIKAPPPPGGFPGSKTPTPPAPQ